MKAQIVSFHCVLKDKLGRIISSSFNSEVINQQCDDGSQKLPGLVAGLQDVRAGERRQIFVPAEQGYGLYDPGLVVKVPRKQLARGACLDIGSEIVTESSPDGQLRTFRVVGAENNCLVLDGNHPLAGQDLTFEIEVTAAREASAEDLNDCNEQPTQEPGRIVH